MDNRNRPNKLYIVKLNLDISNDEYGQSNGTVNGSQWGENKVVA
jgi:hypothetical protein